MFRKRNSNRRGRELKSYQRVILERVLIKPKIRLLPLAPRSRKHPYVLPQRRIDNAARARPFLARDCRDQRGFIARHLYRGAQTCLAS
jgi:hypothetical protein